MAAGVKVTSLGSKSFACCRVGSGSCRFFRSGRLRNSDQFFTPGWPHGAILCSACHRPAMRAARAGSITHDRNLISVSSANRQAPSVSIPQIKLLVGGRGNRSEEHTSELQSHSDLVCRLLLEKKKKQKKKENT